MPVVAPPPAADPWANASASVDTYDDTDLAAPKRPWALYIGIVVASLIAGVVLTRLFTGNDDDRDPPKTAAEQTPDPTSKPAQPEPKKEPEPDAKAIEPEPEPDAIDTTTPEPDTPPTTNPRNNKKQPRTPRTPTPRTPSPDDGSSDAGSGNAAELFAAGNQAFNSGNFGQAEALLSKAVKKAPGNGKYRISLGDALFKQGKYQIARVHYEKARSLGHPLGASRLEKVDAKLGG